nr:hypothetical protein [Microbacterium hydrocarbonoxydans]
MVIAIDFEQIFAELKRISRELEHFPAADEVTVVEGGVSETTSSFRDELRRAAQRMGAATSKTIEALTQAQETIRAAVMQMAEQDAALADESKMIIQLLDSAVAQATETPNTPGAPRAGEAGGGTGAGVGGGTGGAGPTVAEADY